MPETSCKVRAWAAKVDGVIVLEGIAETEEEADWNRISMNLEGTIVPVEIKEITDAG